MTRAQALALVTAMEGVTVPGTASWSYGAGGTETWAVAIPDSFVMTGPLLKSLVDYCAANGLTLSAQFSYLGVT